MNSLYSILLSLFNLEKMMSKPAKKRIKIIFASYLYVNETEDIEQICDLINVSPTRLYHWTNSPLWKNAVAFWGGDVDKVVAFGDVDVYVEKRSVINYCKDSIKNELYDDQEGRCAGCMDHLHQRHLTIDHVIPLSKGGTNDIENLSLLCFYCNTLKGTKSMDHLYRELERQGILIGTENTN